MTGEVNSFRSRFFGGFNREDVVDYIAKLAQERNELEATKTKAENDLSALTLEIEALRSETEEACRVMAEDYDRKLSVFKSAVNAFAGYGESFRLLCEDISAATTGVFTVLKDAGDITARMPALLSQAFNTFEELRVAFSAEKFEDTGEDQHEYENEAEDKSGDNNEEKNEYIYENKYDNNNEDNADIE